MVETLSRFFSRTFHSASKSLHGSNPLPQSKQAEASSQRFESSVSKSASVAVPSELLRRESSQRQHLREDSQGIGDPPPWFAARAVNDVKHPSYESSPRSSETRSASNNTPLPFWTMRVTAASNIPQASELVDLHEVVCAPYYLRQKFVLR